MTKKSRRGQTVEELSSLSVDRTVCQKLLFVTMSKSTDCYSQLKTKFFLFRSLNDQTIMYSMLANIFQLGKFLFSG